MASSTERQEGQEGQEESEPSLATGVVVLVAIAALVAALVALGLGGVFVWAAPSLPDAEVVQCGDDVMGRGDQCIVFGGDTDDTGYDEGGDYSEMRANQEDQARHHRTLHHRASLAFRTGGILFAIAVVLYLVGVVIGTRHQRRQQRQHGQAL